MARVLWRSWTPEWAAFEVPRIRALGLDWHDGYTETPRVGDIFLTNNGRDFPWDILRDKPIFTEYMCASFIAECPQYIPGEYRQLPFDTKWDLRITYNWELTQYDRMHYVPYPGYWACDGKAAYTNERDLDWAMVLTNKLRQLSPCDNGQKRTEFVVALEGHNFAYWGKGWNTFDPNYKGVFFQAFDKHFETRSLLCRSKFALALDTSRSNGFITEKFWHALASGALPVYSGPECIKDVVPYDAFVYADAFKNVNDVIGFCESMDLEEWVRRTEIGREFFLNDHLHSWESCFTRIDDLLQSHNPPPRLLS